MLETIIKRDGSEEAYVPSKLNHWGMWASKYLGDRADWSSAVSETVRGLPEKITSQDLQLELIKNLLEKGDWPSNLMAGRLYAPWLHKYLYGSEKNLPTPQVLMQRLVAVKLARTLDYTQAQWDEVAEIIDHSRDFTYAHFQIQQLRKKYGLQNRVSNTEYESPQFIFMRMAMALAVDEPEDMKMEHVRQWYDHFSFNRINAPSPNYINLGTNLNGYASCVIYKAGDNARSLAIGNHIAETMTYMSAGIGSYIETRTAKDPVRGGAIEHQGKLPYYKSVGAVVTENLQAGRGGACTEYFSAYDNEAVKITQLQNVRAVVEARNRDIHFAMLVNRWVGKKVARDEQIFFFNCYTAPDLHKKLFSSDMDGFEKLYLKYEQDESFKKTYISARELIVANALTQSHEVGTLYFTVIDEMNRHTPFMTDYEPIHSSNLCTETGLPTQAFRHMTDLYTTEDDGYVTFKDAYDNTVRLAWSDRIVKHVTRHNSTMSVTSFPGALENGDVFSVNDSRGFEVVEILEKVPTSEVATCSLAAIVTPNIHSDEMYESAAYYALKMIDKCIHMSHYELPQVGYTAKARMNAGVGIVGTAYDMAKNDLRYDSLEGRNFFHKQMETHYYWLVEASLKLSQERGLAPWIHKTKWPQGWLPIDTYKKTVDELTTEPLHRDWEGLRARIFANGGIGHSVLCNLMPTESSSKASGMPNCAYPIRRLAMKKTDGSNVVDWCAPDGDLLGDKYDIAYDVPTIGMIKFYAVGQKWVDQGISADQWEDRIKNPDLNTTTMITNFTSMIKYGMKGQYYQNSNTSDDQGTGTSDAVKKFWEEANGVLDVTQQQAEEASGRRDKAECVGGCVL